MSDLQKMADYSADVAMAIESARGRIERVASAAVVLSGEVDRTGRDIGKLQDQADRIRRSPNVPPGTILQSAMIDADGLRSRLLRTGGQVDGLRGELEGAAKDLRAGGEAYAKLEDELGGATPEAGQLGKRLTDLSGAVKAAEASLVEAARPIAEARGSLKRLMDTSLGADRGSAAATIQSAQAGARDGARAVGAELNNATANLGQVEPQLKAATTESQALRKAADAALNPTPKERQVVPGSASAQPSATRSTDAPTPERDR